MSRRTYITRRRVDETRLTLTALDWRILKDVDRLGLVSGSQLRRLHYPVGESARRLCRLHLARLTASRALARLNRRIGGAHAGSEGYVYAIDVMGQRLLDPRHARYWPPRTAGHLFVAHSLQVSELYVQLRQAERDGRLRLSRFDGEPRCWRDFAGIGGAAAVLKPDAFVVVQCGDFADHYFIEVDRATESLPRISDKADTYVRYFESGREQRRYGVFPQVVWSTPSPHRSGQIVEVLGRMDADRWNLFAVAAHDNVVDLIRGVAIEGATGS